jgi:uncharacterized protein YjiS (DUF1127 family)
MTMITNRSRDDFRTSLGTAGSHRPLWAVIGAAIDGFVTTLLDWQERARQRRELLGLGDRALRDTGRYATSAEAAPMPSARAASHSGAPDPPHARPLPRDGQSA